MKILQISFWMLLVGVPACMYAQNDTKKETTHATLSKQFLKKKAPDPGKAFLCSIIFPGAGQLYNRKYWKVPVVWAGIAGGILLIDYHQTRYYVAKKELYAMLRDKNYAPPSGFTEDQLRGRINSSQRDRDFFTILTLLWYFLQAVEAHTDAHLYLFSKKTKFELSLSPVIKNNFYGQVNLGVTLAFKF